MDFQKAIYCPSDHIFGLNEELDYEKDDWSFFFIENVFYLNYDNAVVD